MQDAAKWAVVKLSRAYPASFVDEDTVAEKQRLYVELLEAHEWITADDWRTGVGWLIWHHDGEYAPVPAKVIEACREQHRKVRQAETNADVLALPAAVAIDAPPKSYDPAKWDRHAAIGKARQRKRKAGEAEADPTEDDVDAVLREMDAVKGLKGSLDRALAMRVPISLTPMPETVPVWPSAERGRTQ